MAAQSLNCPNCGAAAASDATRCEHCNSRLATVACPQCFGMIFLGAKFCSHCGAKVRRKEVEGAAVRLCPRCRAGMDAVVIGKIDLQECPKCEGLWATAETVQQICVDREQQAAVLGAAAPLPPPGNQPVEKIRYVPCPVCHQLMHRVNFANCSNVVVDVCKPHGTWFDKDELRQIVEFIQTGGFDKARAQEMARWQREKREWAAARDSAVRDQWSHRPNFGYDCREGALAAALGAVVDVFLD